MTAASAGALPGADRRDWRAHLRLSFARHGPRTVLARQEHEGPLLAQKALYPDGADRCHVIILHPPGGIAGGDRLEIDVNAQAGAHALLTTPGASKWYRSGGRGASCTTRVTVEPDAIIEWLPREAIVFNEARVHASLDIDLAAGARCLGWEIWCLGRTASGERWQNGALTLETRLRVSGRLRWEERGVFEGGSDLMQSAAGFAGCAVYATLWAAGADASPAVLSQCRGAQPLDEKARAALTQLPGVLLARYLGASTEDAFNWLAALWSLLRPAYLGCEAVRPRIWAV